MTPFRSRLLEESTDFLERTLASFDFSLKPREVGQILRVERGVLRIRGLPGVQAMELLKSSAEAYAVALNLDQDAVGAVMLDPEEKVQAGDRVWRCERVLDIGVGPDLLGRVIDPLGRPLDGEEPIRQVDRWAVEREAPGILDRAAVTQPLQTGIKVVDALVPIGRGQRELILGDRQTGKTTVAVDTILNQHDKDVICVYCAIGQRAQAVARVIERLRSGDAMKFCVVVSATADYPAGLQFFAPYAATTVGEWFMTQGRDVLVVYDDLTRHADTYRELSLLLRRPPGREAYPGDVFYIHSRLLERATHLQPDRGGGSLTALPIAETQAQNLAAYIPTNLISITDGQLYMSPERYQRGELPAVDLGRSVSRVGGRAQLAAYREVVGLLKLAYAQYEELETFARFGTRLDDKTRQAIERGRRLRELLKQDQGDALTPAEQVAVLFALNLGLFDSLPVQEVHAAEWRIRQAVLKIPEVVERIETGESLSVQDRQRLSRMARAVVRGGFDD